MTKFLHDFLITHRKETHIRIFCDHQIMHSLIISRTKRGLSVLNETGKKGIVISGKDLGKRKQLCPGEQIMVNGYRIKFGFARQRKSGRKHKTSRVERIREVYKMIFQSLQELKPFVSLQMFQHEILLKILQIIPADRAGFFIKKRTQWRKDSEKRRKGKGYTKEDPVHIMERSRQSHDTVFLLDLHVKTTGRKKNLLIHSAVSTPVFQGKKFYGILYIDKWSPKQVFESIHIEALEGISQMAATLMRSTQKLIIVHRQSKLIEEAYFHTITALASSIETRDSYTVAHTQRVTKIAEQIGRALDWAPERLKHVRLGGILHDIGKIGIADRILKKPGILTSQEKKEMQKHPQIGANLVKNIIFLKPVIPFILAHQEHFDGKGYPYQLKGRQIPVEGRLMAVADAFDAMTSDRPYRKAMPVEKVLEEIIKKRGKQFDPKIVDAFYSLYQNGIISTIMEEFKKESLSVFCPFCSSITVIGKEKVRIKKTRHICKECGNVLKY